VNHEIVLVEILDSHGRVSLRERLTLSQERPRFTVGRSVSAEITLDDPHVAAMHAEIELSPEGKLTVSDLDTLNGVTLAGKRLRGAKNAEIADGLLQVGRTRLRIRTSRETLAAEKPDQLRPASILRDPAWLAGIAGLAGVLQLIYGEWLNAPRDLLTVVVTALISGVVGSGVWISFWALLSRMLRGEWRWLRHAAIFLGMAAVFFAINGVLELLWFMFSLPQWTHRTAWLAALAFGCLLYLHLVNASNIAPKRAAIAACIVPILSGGTVQWVQQRQTMQNVNYIGTSLRVYPPALRLSGASSVDAYFTRAAQLRETANEKMKAARAYDDENEAADED